MAKQPIYAPVTRAGAQQTGVLNGRTVPGLGSGPLLAHLVGDGHGDPGVVFVPSTVSADGFPSGMIPVTVSSTQIVS